MSGETPASEELRRAEAALAKASTLLRDGEPKSRWYACNSLWHNTIKLIERIEERPFR